MDSCRLLPSVRGRQPDPRVELFVVEDQVKETVPIRCNRNPVFEEGFLLLIPGNASQAELKVEHRYHDIYLVAHCLPGEGKRQQRQCSSQRR